MNFWSTMYTHIYNTYMYVYVFVCIYLYTHTHKLSFQKFLDNSFSEI